MALEQLLGSRLLSKEGEVKTADAVAGKKNILLYFSAHWCPPCRGFTPQLAKAYTESSLAGKETIVIFVSSDKDQQAFDEYYGEMPWHALPFDDRDRKGALSEQFSVRGIPTLIVLDDQGKIVTANGRAEFMTYLPAGEVQQEPAGPASETLVNLVGSKLLSKEGEIATSEALAGAKHIMIYFSAHWCPPCRGFTPQLAKAYKESAIAGKDTKIVFVSSDQNQQGFDEYYGEMPWHALPFDDQESKNRLSSQFGVSGIPMLVVVDANGTLVTPNGRAEYQSFLGPAGPPVAGKSQCGCVVS